MPGLGEAWNVSAGRPRPSQDRNDWETTELTKDAKQRSVCVFGEDRNSADTTSTAYSSVDCSRSTRIATSPAGTSTGPDRGKSVGRPRPPRIATPPPNTRPPTSSRSAGRPRPARIATPASNGCRSTPSASPVSRTSRLSRSGCDPRRARTHGAAQAVETYRLNRGVAILTERGCLALHWTNGANYTTCSSKLRCHGQPSDTPAHQLGTFRRVVRRIRFR